MKYKNREREKYLRCYLTPRRLRPPRVCVCVCVCVINYRRRGLSGAGLRRSGGGGDWWCSNLRPLQLKSELRAGKLTCRCMLRVCVVKPAVFCVYCLHVDACCECVCVCVRVCVCSVVLQFLVHTFSSWILCPSETQFAGKLLLLLKLK